MGLKIRRVEYFYTTVRDRPGEACKVLSSLSDRGVNLYAFSAVPAGPDRSQLTLFPETVERLADFAEETAMVLDGPHPALLVQGDDRLGALAEIHDLLYQVKINVFASTGVTDGHEAFGYLLYLQPHEVDQALSALSVLT